MALQAGNPARIGRGFEHTGKELMADHFCFRDQLEIQVIRHRRIPDIGIYRITNGGKQNPQYQRIFCDAVIMPPAHLEASIQEKKAPFDRFNIDSLNRMLEPVSLRSDLSREDVVDTFRQYQDYINARYQMTGSEKIDIRDHEESCRRALRILLYGVVERKE